MLKNLNNIFFPQERGFLNQFEMELVENTLHLKEMDILELRNLRDFTVMFYGNLMDKVEKINDNIDEYFKLQDKMSGIVAVIDNEIWMNGEKGLKASSVIKSFRKGENKNDNL